MNTFVYSFYPIIIRAWYLLPSEIITLPSINPFQLAVSTDHLAPTSPPHRLSGGGGGEVI